jgi:hypothetical protein
MRNLNPQSGILDHLVSGALVAAPMRHPSQSDNLCEETRQIPTTNPNPASDILGALIAAGLADNGGMRQRNPKRVAAARAHHAKIRRAKRIAKEALAPPIEPPQRRRRPGFKPIGTRQYDRVVQVMEPGGWYSRGDLAKAVGFSRDARGYVTRALLPLALATRARNPKADTGTSTCPAPAWLYRLTPKGEALRKLCSLLR